MTWSAPTCSDWQLLADFSLGSLRDDASVYKALSALANSGGIHLEEGNLPEDARKLLSIRRMMSTGRLDEASERLLRLAPRQSLHAGDRLALLSIVSHRKGDLMAGLKLGGEAHHILREANEHHRALRAMINAEICRSDPSNSLTGVLYSLSCEAKREGYDDLSGNIHKARAGNLLVAGKFSEALSEALVAVQHYEQDGHPEDRAVAQALVSILHLIRGQPGIAKVNRDKIALRGGKLEAYLEIYSALARGNLPLLECSHPLAKAPWPVLSFARIKHASIKGRLIALLRERPQSRDELITGLWGNLATDPSYCNRLYSTVNQLRKLGCHLEFDGSYYHLH